MARAQGSGEKMSGDEKPKEKCYLNEEKGEITDCIDPNSETYKHDCNKCSRVVTSGEETIPPEEREARLDEEISKLRKELGEVSVKLDETKKATEKSARQTINIRFGMIGVLVVALLIAIIPQIVYEFWLIRNPDFQFTWQMRDRFLLFSFTSHLTIILITIAGIIAYILMSKGFDLIMELIVSTQHEVTALVNRVKGMFFDIETIKPLTDELTETYHLHKGEITEANELVRYFLKILPAFNELYGERIKRMAAMDKEHQKEALKDLIDKME